MPKDSSRMDEASRIEEVFDTLWPLHRSITGDGVRKSHDILGAILPLTRHEIPSGSSALDWTVPDEWNVNEAYVIAPDQQRILDVAENNLHLLNYSAPFFGTVSRQELDQHLYSDPERPDSIPYRTSYYKRTWGFCIPHKQRLALPEGDYQVVVNTTIEPGSLTLSEAILPGSEDRQVLFTTYTCHPSLAINELSGPLLTAFLYTRIAAWKERRLTYRFVFGPETIGAVCYLSMYGEEFLEKLDAGYIVTCVGDDGDYTLKRSKRADTLADRAARLVLEERGLFYNTIEFHPSGSDERQYCSIGYNLPVASLMRTSYGTFNEYHTSLDDKSLMDFEAMTMTLDVYEAVAAALDNNRTPLNLITKGEPQFSKRGDLYPREGLRMPSGVGLALKWLIHYSDGRHDLIRIAEMSGLPIELLGDIATRAVELGVFKFCEQPGQTG